MKALQVHQKTSLDVRIPPNQPHDFREHEREPSRNIRKIWRKLIEIIRTPNTAGKSLITEESYGTGCRDDSGSRPTFRRPRTLDDCHQPRHAVSAAHAFTTKRAAAVRCWILNTNFRMRLSTDKPSLYFRNHHRVFLFTDESPPQKIINDEKEQQRNQER